MFDTLLEKRFLTSLEHLHYGSAEIITPEGKTYRFKGAQPGAHAHLKIHQWSVVLNLSLRGDIGFAEDYRSGLWESNDLVSLFLCAFQNEAVLNPYIQGGTIGRMAAWLANRLDANTMRGSRRNIASHYDLGNQFYALWLDPSMTYSSALFSNTSENLQAAQLNKYDRILQRLGKESGRILEIGCGWGGFAERAVDMGDHHVRGITLSKEQHAYAQRRIQRQANFVLEDYRKQEGKFDHIVSIEMFEAVGERYWRTYFSKLASLLKSSGKAVVQTITIDDAMFDRYRKGSDMIRSFIFPGGMLPSPSRFATEAEHAGLKLTDRFTFGQDYALTLRHWLARFDAARSQISALGFDEGFIRLWRFYLATCIAGFETKRIDVMQVEMQHA